MKLVQLSVASILACLVGLVALGGFSVYGLQQVRDKQDQVAGLLSLQKRIDDISVTSDRFLLYRPDPEAWRAYRADIEAARRQLLAYEDTPVSAQQALHHLEVIVAELDAILDGEEIRADPAETGVGPLGIPEQAREAMSRIASHGAALDTELDRLLRQRQELIAREAIWIAAGFAGAAVLFGIICVFAFTLLYRRISRPARALEQTFRRLADGDRNARLPISGSDEFGQLARTFNHMLDRRRQAEDRLHEYGALIEGSRDLYAIFDADYHYVMTNQAYAEAYGFDANAVVGTHVRDQFGERFFQREIKPRIDEALAGRITEFEAERDYRDRGLSRVLIRYYPIASDDGRIERVGATVTDVTALKQAEAELHEKARLLDMAGRVGRFGGWTVDLPSERIEWSDVVAEIHDMPPGYSPSLEEGLGFYAPECRERIRERFNACAERGTPFDEELQITTANGERRWIRSVGVPVRDEKGRITQVEGAFQDITERKSAEHEAEQLNRHLATMLDSITDGFFAIDHQWRYTYVNAEAARMVEQPVEDLLGAVVWEQFPDLWDMEMGQGLRRAMDKRVPVSVEEYFPPLEKWFDVRAYPSEEGLSVYFRDATERREMVERLREHEQELQLSHDRLAGALKTRQALINSLPAHIALLDAEGTIIDVNDQWRHFARDNEYTEPDSGVGLNYLDVCRHAGDDRAEEAPAAVTGLQTVLAGEQDTFTLEYPCHAPDRFRWFRMMANRLASDNGGEAGSFGAVVMHIDITERKLAEQELQRIANEDPVSGALTRHGFVEAFRRHVESAGWQASGMVVMLDIEGQRDINDAHGYQAGDQVLAQVARRLRERTGNGGIVARTGGDEFAVFMPPGPRQQTGRRRHALTAVFEEPFRVDEAGEQSIEAGARFGYTMLSGQERGAESLLREAELALFEAHTRGPGEWAGYTSDLERATHERVEMTHDLRRALEKEEFELHFQPKVELDSGRLISCEALLRWHHPQRGLQSPALFIPVAEQSQLMGPIGDWALFEACRLLREWQDAGLDVVRVAVNVSMVQFRLGRFVDRVREAIAVHGIDPGGLTLEITESVFEQESEMLRTQLRELHELGVRLSLDDFGTGYSSLLYLQQYPFDEIKIDQGFVQQILDDRYSRKIVTTVLGIAGALGADAVAEGVETEAVRDALLAMGCRLGQGYYYSFPLEVEDFRWLLEKQLPLPLGEAEQRKRGT